MPEGSGGNSYPPAFSAALLGFVLVLAYLARALFLSVLLAAALAYLLHPLVAALERRGLSRSGAIGLAFAAVAIIGAAIGLALLPDLTAQLTRLAASLPDYACAVEHTAARLEATYLARFPTVLGRWLDQRIFTSEAALAGILNQLLAGLLQAVKMALWLVMVPVFAFYFLRDGARWKELALGLFPGRLRGAAAVLLTQMDALMAAFLRGQLLVCAVVAFLSWGALFLLGVDWAVLLGLFAGLAELIPYFGPLVGAAPAVGAALAGGPWLALKVAAAFLIIQQVEGNIISPKLLGDRLGLHPLAVIVALVAGGRFGVAGLLLAVPALAFLAALIRFLMDRLAA